MTFKVIVSIILQTINSKGYGTLDKIFLEYEDAWWPKDCEGIQLVWTEDIPDFERKTPHTKLVGGKSKPVLINILEYLLILY